LILVASTLAPLNMAAPSASAEFEVVRECPEWQTLREMEERIEQLAFSEQQMEARLTQRFGGLMSEMMERLEAVEVKVDILGPMTQSLSMSHIDAQMELERMDETINEMQYPEDLEMSVVGDAMATLDVALKELQKKVDNSLSPMMQSFALAQMDNLAFQQDTSSKLEELGSTKLKAKLDSLSDLEAWTHAKLATVEDSIRKLRIQPVKKVEAACQADVQTEAAAPSSVPACMLDTTPQELTSFQDLVFQEAFDAHSSLLTPFEQALMTGGSSKHSVFMKQMRSPGKEFGSPMKFSGSPKKSSASKAIRSEKLQKNAEWLDSLSVPFASSAGSTIGFRTLERTSGSRSLPFLPPVF